MPPANKPDTGNQAQRSALSKETATSAQRANKSDLASKKAAASDKLTAKEMAALASYAERGRATIDVRLKPSGDPPSVGTDHADRIVGQVLLMHALGTADSAFASGLISQLEHLNRDEEGIVNYHGLNFMFSVIKGLAPRDQLEAMLAAQMAAVHVNAIRIAKVLTESLDSVERESMERSLTSQGLRP